MQKTGLAKTKGEQSRKSGLAKQKRKVVKGRRECGCGGRLAEDGELLGSQSRWRGYYRQQSKGKRQ